MSDKISCEVNKDTLDMLIKGLCQLRGNPLTEDSSWDEVEGPKKGRNGRSNKKNSPSDVDHRDLNAVLNKLMDTVNSLLAKQQEEQAARESIKQRIAELEERVQSQSVESDEIKQRSVVLSTQVISIICPFVYNCIYNFVLYLPMLFVYIYITSSFAASI